MPYNWKEKTGLTEQNLLQIVAALLSFAGHKLGYGDIAIYAGMGSQIIIGALGVYLRNIQKKKEADNG